MASTFSPPAPKLGAHFTQAPKSQKVLKHLLETAKQCKENPLAHQAFTRDKTMVLLFFNPSLRTRLSTQKAAINLGMSVMTLNAAEGWKLEFEDEVIMNSDKAEHIREAAQVIAQYADIIGIRSFPSLTDQEKDYQDYLLQRFMEFSTVPVLSLESSIRHPLQSLTDMMTIEAYKTTARPKVVLSWAPHPKALPQAVANSFAEWMHLSDAEFVITHPPGYELAPQFAQDAPIIYDQQSAFANADFIYTKNWSSFQDYGKSPQVTKDWQITPDKMALTNDAWFMHCLPVRRNVVVADAVLDSPKSLVIEQANNRTFAAQAVIKTLLES